MKLLGDAAAAASRSALSAPVRSAARSVARSALFSAAAHSNDSAIISAVNCADLSATLNEVYSASSAAAWSAASWDADAPMQRARLWGDIGQPEGLRQGWEALKQQWEEDAAVWSFWVEWYERILNGDPMDRRLIFRIATEVTEEEWEAGQGVVAARIADIQADFVVETLPQFEEIFEDAEGLYDVRAAAGDLSKLIDSVLRRVIFALDTAVKSNSCDLNEMSLACKILRFALEHAHDDPNTFEACLRNASSEIRAGLECGIYDEDGEIRYVLQTLDETALQLRADHPDVAQPADTRLKQRLREIDDVKRLEMAQRIDAMQEGSATRLRQEFGLAAEITRGGASIEAKAEAIKQSANRAGKISLSERAKQTEGSGWMSATKIGLRAKDLVDMVIGILSGGG